MLDFRPLGAHRAVGQQTNAVLCSEVAKQCLRVGNRHERVGDGLPVGGCELFGIGVSSSGVEDIGENRCPRFGREVLAVGLDVFLSRDRRRVGHFDGLSQQCLAITIGDSKRVVKIKPDRTNRHRGLF